MQSIYHLFTIHLTICWRCVTMRRDEGPYRVMYSSRSACRESVSLRGLIFRPQSHTLLREARMSGDIWTSGCRGTGQAEWEWCSVAGEGSTDSRDRERRGRWLRVRVGAADLWFREDDHAHQVHPHVGPQAPVPQQLWGLGTNVHLTIRLVWH